MMLSTVLILTGALVLDRLFGEPRRCHPLVIWSGWAVRVEQCANNGSRWQGGWSWLLLVAVPVLAVYGLLLLCNGVDELCGLTYGFSDALAALCVYLSLGWQSLREHGQAVATALGEDIGAARLAVGRIVSRDTDLMDRPAVLRATLESLLENGADAIFAPLFWFLVAGPLGAVAYRLANTLDAMWGYRTMRFAAFGWCSAKADDALNFLPARLTALSYALLGQTRQALSCWWLQANRCASPNGGPVMCAGAGSLSVVLGGKARYHGQWLEKPLMGAGAEPVCTDIERTIRLIDDTVYLWLAWLLLAMLMWEVI